MKNKEYRWYVEPLDAHTNEVVAREVGAERLHLGLPDEDGIPRNVWECQWPLVNILRRSRKQLNLQFLVFVREGQGKMRSAGFLGKRKRPWGASKPSRAA